MIERARRLQARALETPPGRAALIFTEKQGPHWAVLLAWNALTAMFPILLLPVWTIPVPSSVVTNASARIGSGPGSRSEALKIGPSYVL